LPAKQGGKKLNKPFFQHQTKREEEKVKKEKDPLTFTLFMCQVIMS
jgi:hypothetical protein